MARLVWALLARDSVVDKDNNALHIHHILEEVTVRTSESLPLSPMEEGELLSLPLESTLLMFWVRDDLDAPETSRVRISLRCPDGKVYPAGDSKIDLTKYKRLRLRNRSESLPFHGSGEYVFLIERYDYQNESFEIGARIPIEITVLGPED